MSFDPFGYNPDHQPPANQPQPEQPQPPEHGIAPTPPPAEDPSKRIQRMVYIPAVLLIISGIINLLCSLLPAISGVQTALTPLEKIKESQQQALQLLRDMGYGGADPYAGKDPQTFKTNNTIQMFVTAAVLLLAGLLSIVGGLRMYKLRGYGLAMTGAIVTALPCISCTGCCGFGEVVGIWAVVVLLNPDVRNAFQ